MAVSLLRAKVPSYDIGLDAALLVAKPGLDHIVQWAGKVLAGNRLQRAGARPGLFATE